MKNHKCIKIASVLFCLIFLISICFSVPVSALSQYDSVSITTVVQAKSNWCWAACAEMLGKNVYSSTQRDQYSIVNFVKLALNYPNEAGTLSEIRRGVRYSSHYKASVNYVSSAWSYGNIAASIYNGYGVIAAAGYYTNNVRQGGHAVVIYATQFVDGSSGSRFYISYIDPWDGTRNQCLYSSFCDGTYNGRIYDGTVYVS